MSTSNVGRAILAAAAFQAAFGRVPVFRTPVDSRRLAGLPAPQHAKEDA